MHELKWCGYTIIIDDDSRIKYLTTETITVLSKSFGYQKEEVAMITALPNMLSETMPMISVAVAKPDTQKNRNPHLFSLWYGNRRQKEFTEQTTRITNRLLSESISRICNAGIPLTTSTIREYATTLSIPNLIDENHKLSYRRIHGVALTKLFRLLNPTVCFVGMLIEPYGDSYRFNSVLYQLPPTNLSSIQKQHNTEACIS